MIIDSLKNLAVAIDSLQGLPGNPRIGDVDAVAASLEKFGQRKPIVVRKDDGTIIAGNHTWQAAKKLGWKEIAVAFVGDDDTTAQAYALADNRTAELGSYDEQALKDLIDKVAAVDPELVRISGWSDDAVKELVNKIQSELPKDFTEDEIPEPPVEPITKLGDIWQLGRHRLMCGDSTIDYNKLLLNKKVDMLLTDPPYGINLDTDYKGMPSRWNDKETYRNKFTKVAGDEKPVDMSFLQNIECKEMFLFGADYYAYSLPNSGADGTWYVWDKREDDDGSSYDKMLTAPFELCWGKKKRGKKFIRMRWAGFMSSDNAKGERPIGRVHPTQKPVALASWFIEKFSEPNWLILDLFGGAGFTLLAAEQTNRICYMMELDPKYCDVIIKRWENLTGEKAVLINAKSA